MTFLEPARLWLLVGVVALGTGYVLAQRARSHYATRFSSLEMLPSVAPQRPGWQRHLVAAATVIGLAALVLGIARPARDERIPREEAVVMLVVDVSASMTAVDVEPTRLDAASEAAKEFVAEIPDKFQVGLVAFHGTSRVFATPTTDHTAVVLAIDRLTIGRGGTATGDGLQAGLDAIAAKLRADAAAEGRDPDEAAEGDLPATVVLLSDGATTGGLPLDEAAEAANDADVPVNTIAFGTDAGVVNVDGRIVHVPADKEAMAAVADLTGGTYFEAASADELRSVYEDIQGRVGYTTERREIVRAFLGVGLVALATAAGASVLLLGRFL